MSYIFGGVNHPPPPEFIRSKRVVTTTEMMTAVLTELEKGQADVFISAAAPADLTPERPAETKIPTRVEAEAGLLLDLRLKPTRKIIDEVRKRWPELPVVAFKAETAPSRRELELAGKRFMQQTGVEFVVANDVSNGKVFGADSSSVLILDGRRTRELGEQPKDDVAKAILDVVAARLNERKKEGKKGNTH